MGLALACHFAAHAQHVLSCQPQYTLHTPSSRRRPVLDICRKRKKLYNPRKDEPCLGLGAHSATHSSKATSTSGALKPLPFISRPAGGDNHPDSGLAEVGKLSAKKALGWLKAVFLPTPENFEVVRGGFFPRSYLPTVPISSGQSRFEDRNPTSRPTTQKSRFVPICPDQRPAFCLFSLFFSRNSSFFCVLWFFFFSCTRPWQAVIQTKKNLYGIVLAEKFILLSFSSESKKLFLAVNV